MVAIKSAFSRIFTEVMGQVAHIVEQAGSDESRRLVGGFGPSRTLKSVPQLGDSSMIGLLAA